MPTLIDLNKCTGILATKSIFQMKRVGSREIESNTSQIPESIIINNGLSPRELFQSIPFR